MSCGDGKGPVTAYCFEIDADGPMGHRDFARGLEEIYMREAREHQPFVRVRMKPDTLRKLYEVLRVRFEGAER